MRKSIDFSASTDEIIESISGLSGKEIDAISKPKSPQKGDRLVHLAIRRKDERLLNKLIELKASLNITKAEDHDPADISPLALAAQESSVECIELLIKHIPKKDINDKVNTSALCRAIQSSYRKPDKSDTAHYKCCKALIDAGFNPNDTLLCLDRSSNEFTVSALYMAAQCQSKTITQLLLDCPELDINKGRVSKSSRPISPLEFAKRAGNVEITKMLSDHTNDLAQEEAETPHFVQVFPSNNSEHQNSFGYQLGRKLMGVLKEASEPSEKKDDEPDDRNKL